MHLQNAQVLLYISSKAFICFYICHAKGGRRCLLTRWWRCKLRSKRSVKHWRPNWTWRRKRGTKHVQSLRRERRTFSKPSKSLNRSNRSVVYLLSIYIANIVQVYEYNNDMLGVNSCISDRSITYYSRSCLLWRRGLLLEELIYWLKLRSRRSFWKNPTVNWRRGGWGPSSSGENWKKRR